MNAHAHPGEETHHGPSVRGYVMIGLLLAVITAIELWASYAEDVLGGVLVPALLAMSAVKFAIVVGWFMHLRFDSRLFTWMFVGGLSLAGSVLVALILLFWTNSTDIELAQAETPAAEEGEH